MRKLWLLAMLSLMLSIVSCTTGDHADATTIEWQTAPAIPDSVGLSALYGGVDNGSVVVAGGCNFPNESLVDGGKKVFSDRIYTLAPKAEQWSLSADRLPVAAAYGVSISTTKGLYFIGGTADGAHSLTTVLNYQAGKLTDLNSPMLSGRDNMGGALIGTNIYIAGGYSNGEPTNEVAVFDTRRNQWTTIEPMPGPFRVQPVVVAQDAAEEKRLYVMGGFDPVEKKVLTDGYQYSPKLKKWIAIYPAPVAINGGEGFSLGVHTILVVGGVDEAKFNQALSITDDSTRTAYNSHDCQWYNFNTKLLAYNTIVNRWCDTGTVPGSGRAGAKVIGAVGGQYYIVMGETKPGVRTPEVLVGRVVSDKIFGAWNWAVVIVYLLSMIGLGVFFWLRTKNSDSYFKGGGKIPWWAVSISIFATMLSAITFMAIPAKTYATDWRYFLMAITILIAAFPVVKYYLPFFRRLNITSAYEYLELRFNVATRVMSSILFIIFMVARMALVLYLPSLALTAATGIDIYSCILMMSLITIIYSSIGGIEAVVWGDVVQGIILMGGALFTIAYIVMHTDGSAWQIAMADDKFQILNFDFDFTTATVWTMLLGGFAIQIISYTSDQTVIQRYMTVSSEKKAGKSIITNGILSLISSLLFYAMGTALYAYFQTRPETLDIAMPTADSIFPFYIMSQLPVGVAGLLIAAIFAAAMSTISSNINSIATAFTVDIFQKLRPKANDHARLQSARYSSVIFGVIGCGFALIMATWNVYSLYDWFNTMLGILTSGLGALFFIGIFFDRIDGRDALIGFVLGNAALICISIYTSLFFFLYGLIGMLAITFIALVSSYILPRTWKSNKGLTWRQLNHK
ncbi:MAG: sodium/solute symporter [Mucinivorans sp.]